MAGDRIERGDAPGIPDDQLSRAAGGDDDRLPDAKLGVGRQRAPDFLAGDLVERDHLGIPLAADERDQAIAVDERRAGEPPIKAPLRAVRAVVGRVVFLPEDVAALHVQAEELAVGAREIHAIAVDRGCRARTKRPRHPAVVRRPFPRPQNLPGLFVQGQRALRAAQTLRRREVCDKDPPVGDSRPGEPGLDRRPPQDM